MLNEPVEVNDGYRDKGSSQALQRRSAQKAADNLGTVKLITVQSCTDEQSRPVFRSTHYMHRQRQRRMRIQGWKLQLYQMSTARWYDLSTDNNFFGHQYSALAACFGT